MSQGFPERYHSRVLANQPVCDTAYELIIDRAGLEFQAGHEIMIHGDAPEEDRQYSIASGVEDEHLHILYRIIPDGLMTPKLKKKQPGDSIEFTGAIGNFLIRNSSAPIVFIATGTGVAPTACFVRSHPGINLTLLHGVRQVEDLFYHELFKPYHYEPCISGDAPGRYFHGRVTDRLANSSFGDDTHYYLCGSNDMILEIRSMLKKREVPDNQIFTEAYFFW